MSIDDVAAHAGVSRATVSRAFARPERVHQVTRERVLAAAAELHYRPLTRTSSRAGAKLDRTLGLFVPDVTNPFFAPFIKVVELTARQRGYAVMIVDSDEQAEIESDLVEMMAARVDGLILMAPRMPDAKLVEICRTNEVVVLYRHTEGVANSVLVTEDGLGQAMRQLHTLGHHEVIYLAGPATSYSNRTRRQAIVAAAAELDVDLTELGPFEPRFEEGQRAADLVCALPATTVIAYNDLIAVGLMSQLALRGMTVGRDVSVIGVDDTWLAAIWNPPLTTVRQPIEEVARTAVRMLIDEPSAAAAPGEPRTTTFPTRLIIRASLGPVPPERPAIALAR